MKEIIVEYEVSYALGVPTCQPFYDFHCKSNMPCDDIISKSLRLFS